MLTLYYRPTCAYCQHVLGEIESLGIKVVLKNISSDPSYQEELLSLGGKVQVPYLSDTEKGIHMYESNDIVAYISQHYSADEPKSFGGLRIHKSEDICDTCQ